MADINPAGRCPSCDVELLTGHISIWVQKDCVLWQGTLYCTDCYKKTRQQWPEEERTG